MPFPSRLLSATALLLGLSACASFPPRLHTARLKVKALPLAEQVISPQQRANAYYQDARSAIERREYAAALQLLQAARDAKGDDVRVLNGFGVVYDKLGRFDLSARYYAEAQALDPASPVVANNIAYSAWLQGRPTLAVATPALAAMAPEPVLATPPHPAPPPPALAAAAPPAPPTPAPSAKLADAAADPTVGRVVYESPGVVRLVLPSQPATTTLALAPGHTGRALVVVNASGRSGAAEPVRLQLVSLGWTAPEVAATSAAAQDRSTIRYPVRDEVAARALARTLPMKPTLVACADGCQDIRLFVGRDAVGQRPAKPAKRRS
ncbi:LytR C-terminal domain-containing protein [Caulobacter sp. KR2-114]|uniref:LytR C-terminal domain-containing protein n=1 Tax=Caulobacter sp. KR2-114 TaxID=3400912 RepID=UPI003C10D3E1